MTKEAVPIPHYLADRPKDQRGWPATYTSIKLPDGRYDFTTTDPAKWNEVVAYKLCALCGKPLNRDFWFIGGPKCMAYHLFFDVAMHQECSRYALVVCPYIANPRYFEAKSRLYKGPRKELVSSDKDKPQVFGLAMAYDYRPVTFQGDLLVQAGKWGRPIEWWKDGKALSIKEAFDAQFSR